LRDRGLCGWYDAGRGVVGGALQESECMAALLTFAGPGADVDCPIGESVDVTNDPCIAELPMPGTGAIFTAM
jgi:hypothetical protein